MTNSPAEMLEAEQRTIAKVVSAAGLLADKRHHGKEEDLLFPLLAQRGVLLRGCPVEALRHEHLMGRALVKGLAEAVGRETRQRLELLSEQLAQIN